MYSELSHGLAAGDVMSYPPISTFCHISSVHTFSKAHLCPQRRLPVCTGSLGRLGPEEPVLD